MQRMYRAILFISMIVCSGASLGAQENSTFRKYFLNGQDADDGTSASIDEAHKFMVVSGEKFDLAQCKEARALVCIDSGYMTFMLPSGRHGEEWSWNNASFKLKQTCRDGSLVIESNQANGLFVFYVDSEIGVRDN